MQLQCRGLGVRPFEPWIVTCAYGLVRLVCCGAELFMRINKIVHGVLLSVAVLELSKLLTCVCVFHC
jgi:hypothetical protein